MIGTPLRIVRADWLPSCSKNYCITASVGPNVPRGNRLTPDALNNVLGFGPAGSTRNPMKQFCISSQF